MIIVLADVIILADTTNLLNDLIVKADEYLRAKRGTSIETSSTWIAEEFAIALALIYMKNPHHHHRFSSSLQKLPSREGDLLNFGCCRLQATVCDGMELGE